MLAILNIKKIINVGEMPRCCEECDLYKREFVYSSGRHENICLAMNQILTNTERKEKRPDTCPLVTYDECFDWMFFRQPATPHIEDILSGKYVPEDLKK